MKFFINGVFSKCDQIRSFLWICSHLLKKSLMENFIFCAVFLTDIINKSFQNGEFQSILKYAEVFPVLRMSKVFERLIYKQTEEFMISKLSPLLRGFRNNHSTQHCVLNMTDSWKKKLTKVNM